ncbi:hypothetical protein ACDX78_10360 [Virgibacillus oceani]
MKTVPVSIQQCEGFWGCVTTDAWVAGIGTVIGAFLGAGLGILGAYFLFKKEFSESRKEKISTFKAEFKQAHRWIELSISALKELERKWEQNEVLNPLLETHDTLFSKTNEFISKIPTNYIPSEVVDDFDELIYELSGLGFYNSMYKHDLFLNETDKDEMKRDLSDTIVKVEGITEKIIDFISK